ncbi:hypothetical protein CAPTEDRAFT_158003 [Capitella teleta]|uniref:G-patch domain-containing protein n=1 Tax=Capitella teleta TaxID=283909 RepID=R7TWX6_CAPTE|nr:hypothetical protein CAPTEDRAFT_158003 [Capitella teleta]|eukprot:ELT98408.1 hypothetical protein CAPTEDRAFT_158003 [Capitella teleta]
MAQLRAGGKSLGDLTDYCKRIAEKQRIRRGDDDSSGDEASIAPTDDEDALFINHPFKVKDAPIIMNIRNSRQLPVLTINDKSERSKTLRLEFPVSSGSQHRRKEDEWVPVEKPSTASELAMRVARECISKKVEVAAMRAAAEENNEKVFAAAVHNKDINIGELVSARLSAMRKLQDNPMDVEAMNSMYKSQKQMSQWAESKQLPGQFLGSTGAQVLSQQELLGDPRNQAWAKKDTFKKAMPVTGGVGKFLLEKMGWREGTGLGKEGRGTLEPIMLDVKNDRKGLNADGEGDKKSQLAITTAGAGPTAGKHPVSALMELCKRRRWATPTFDQVSEHGPPHRKMFLFKARVNNVDYQPNVASGTKKAAKLNAAIVCLQTLGIPCQSS